MKGTRQMQAHALVEQLIAQMPKRFPIAIELHVESVRVEKSPDAPPDEPPSMVTILFNILPKDADPNAAAWPQTEITVPGTFATDIGPDSVVNYIQQMAADASAVDLVQYARCGMRHYDEHEVALQADEDDEWIEKRTEEAS